jgi:hypothetical protein
VINHRVSHRARSLDSNFLAKQLKSGQGNCLSAGYFTNAPF